MRWRVVLPIKPRELAKTRLRNATPSAARHGELVRAIQLDTIDAVLAVGPLIAGVHIVGGADTFPDGAPPELDLRPDPGLGLNAALSQSTAWIQAHWPEDAIIAMVADLPALRPAELRAVLSAASIVRRGVVLDAASSGSTMLTAAPGRALRPEFGLDSAARHRDGGAIVLPAGPGARYDVDTAADLQQCLRLGVGEHTARMVAYLV